MSMSDKPTLHNNRLATLRRILWIAFGGVSVPLALLLIPLVILMGNLESLGVAPPPGISSGLLLAMAGGFMITLIGLTGVICLVIYNIVKYRLERDDELFL